MESSIQDAEEIARLRRDLESTDRMVASMKAQQKELEEWLALLTSQRFPGASSLAELKAALLARQESTVLGL
jgi:hypothetical protein